MKTITYPALRKYTKKSEIFISIVYFFTNILFSVGMILFIIVNYIESKEQPDKPKEDIKTEEIKNNEDIDILKTVAIWFSITPIFAILIEGMINRTLILLSK